MTMLNNSKDTYINYKQSNHENRTHDDKQSNNEVLDTMW